MINPPIAGKRAALLSVDFQVDIAKDGGRLAPTDDEAKARFEHAIERAEQALATARSLGLMIAHVRMAFADGHLGINGRTPLGQHISKTAALREGDDGAEFLASVAPTAGELIVTKRMVSAFEGTDLDQQLRARDIDTVIVMGLVTHFAVEGTVRSAADRGYRVVTLADCCASGQLVRHEAALDVLSFLGPVIRVSSLASSVETRSLI